MIPTGIAIHPAMEIPVTVAIPSVISVLPANPPKTLTAPLKKSFPN